MSKSILILLSTLITIFYPQDIKAQSEPTHNNTLVKDSLTSKLEMANKDGELVGFSVAVIDQKSVLYNEGFGFIMRKVWMHI